MSVACCFFCVSILFFSLLIIYWPGFSGDWYLDDFGNILQNPNVHPTSLSASELSKSFYGMDRSHSRIDRPLAYLSLALNYYIGGTDPFGYHVVNFTIHFAAAVFLFLLTLNILRLPALKERYERDAVAIALLSTFLWATHPIQVNAVTYIVQRMAALAGLFTLVSLYCYLKGRTIPQPDNRGYRPLGWYAGCVLAGLCAVASKQNAAMLPVSLLLFEFLLIRAAPFSGQIGRRLKVLLPPLAIFILLFFLMGGPGVFTADYGLRPFTMLERVLTQPRVIIFYIVQLAYPFGATFALLHDITVSTTLFSPWTTLPAIALLLLAAGGCLLLSRRWPLFAFSTLFFFLNHVIEGSIVPLELIFEHRNYLPSLFFFLLPAAGFMRAVRFFSYSRFLQRLIFLGAGVWMFGQLHTTFQQNSLFQNQILFWHTNVALYPNLHRPRHNLAKALLIEGYEEDAEKLMRQSLGGKSSAKIHQKYITIYNLGVYYFYKLEYQKALDHFFFILKSSPNHIKSLQKVSEIYLETGAPEHALKMINRALQHAPNVASLHVIKGFIFLSLRQVESAFAEAKTAERLKANKASVYYILGEGHRMERDLERSLYYFEMIVSIERKNFAAWLSLAELYYLKDNQPLLDKAIAFIKILVTDEGNIEKMLSTYDRRWNFIGIKRMRILEKLFLK